MKYLKIMFLGALLLFGGCSSNGPTIKDLDSMNKKISYMYHQAGSVIEGLNNLVANKMLVPGTKTYAMVDKAVNTLYDTVEAMETARTLEDMIRLEADALSAIATLRNLLVQISKEGVKQDAKCNLCVGPTNQWAYS